MKWEEERFKKEALIRSIAEYHQSHFGHSPGNDSYRRVTGMSPDEEGFPEIPPNTDGRVTAHTMRGRDSEEFFSARKRNRTTTRTRRRLSTQEEVHPVHPNLPKDREVLFQRTKVMSTGHYSVEISRSKAKCLFVSAVRLENHSESY